MIDADNEHEKYLAKIRSMAKAADIGEIEKKIRERLGPEISEQIRQMTCFNCRTKSKCPEFRDQRTGGIKGVVSIGRDTVFICENWEPQPIRTRERALSDNQIKAMVKNAKKGRL